MVELVEMQMVEFLPSDKYHVWCDYFALSVGKPLQDTWRGVILKEVNRVVQLCGNPPERAIIALCPEMHCHAKQSREWRETSSCAVEKNCSSVERTSCSGEVKNNWSS